jgi:hypothetical protein
MAVADILDGNICHFGHMVNRFVDCRSKRLARLGKPVVSQAWQRQMTYYHDRPVFPLLSLGLHFFLSVHFCCVRVISFIFLLLLQGCK